MLTSEQIRAARAMLRIEQTALAEMSGVSVESIRRFEKMDGEVRAQEATIGNITRALEAAGVIFMDRNEGSSHGGPGVRLAYNQAAEEWNEKLFDVLGAISLKAHRFDYRDILEEFISDDGEIQFVPIEHMEAALLKILDHVGSVLSRHPGDVNDPDLFSSLQSSENQ